MAVAAVANGVRADPIRPASQSTAVRTWLYVLAALVVAMVAVGGATRLTGSGLSITEWRPVTGALPPLSEQAWLAEFEKYRQIPQYELLNKGMTLSEFKFIYGWEWSHRQLGRLMGLVFFLPLVWFWVRGAINHRLALTLLGIGALGGLQGAIGWIMVASGLQPGMTAVAPIKLTLHLTTASVIYACLLWVAAGLGREKAGGAPRVAPAMLLGLVFLQIALGGLVAGSKAGYTYNTWPLMDGALVPPASALFVVKPWIENFVDNVALVQFNHRLVAYAIVAFTLWHALSLKTSRPATKASRRATALAGLTLFQMGLGIVTLVLVVPLWAGLAHQVFAMAVLGMAVVHLRLSLLE
ncbi:COX15/CtaA family protein [Microvirga pudoricolor]|uniref:COX15/CtaA family protein n=1 Tax=Microvirga pudoricolor TaxID=2778729 RepID=UPI001951ABAC|nr:COX15/CtaA family protein [Microvirga pudoricolor]MBM6595585.1 COX15/CtaA family protein [Microvirga pudoricolor]